MAWTYVAYRWNSREDYEQALTALSWENGTPPSADLLVSGTIYDAEDQPLSGFYVAGAFKEPTPPPSAWAANQVEPPEKMAVLGRAPVPAKVTNFQARAVLMQTPSPTPGVSLFQFVDDALRAGKSASPEAALAWQAWEQANDFYRNGALVNNLGMQFGLTASQIDAMFRAAEKIDA